MAFMIRVIEICQTSLRGRRLAIISISTYEGPPAVGSRGSEAATSLSGAARIRVCFFHVPKKVAMEVGLNANKSN